MPGQKGKASETTDGAPRSYGVGLQDVPMFEIRCLSVLLVKPPSPGLSPTTAQTCSTMNCVGLAKAISVIMRRIQRQAPMCGCG